MDEFSAVSRRLPIWQLYERARSLGLAVQVSAQSWPGLAADDDERYRVATTADGGIWLLRTPHPEPVAALAGARRVVDTARRLLGVPLWAHEGLSRAEGTPVVDPEIIRGLDVGQAAYIYRGGVTYVQIKRLVAGPAELPARSAAARPARRRGRGRTGRAWRREAGRPGRPAGRMRAGAGGPGAAGPAGAATPPGAGGRSRPSRAGRHQRAAGRGVRGGAVMGLPGGADPFSALGLPARADLTDDDVRSAWRRIAAATHPDRADGGDPGRFALAAAAYTMLQTRSGRGEALADLASFSPRAGRPRPAGPLRPASPAQDRPGRPPAPAGRPAEPGPAPVTGIRRWRLVSRIRRGRPARLALRILIAVAVGSIAVAVAGLQPATPALITGALTWLLLTARHDLAPPP